MVVKAHKIPRLVEERQRLRRADPWLRLTEIVVRFRSGALVRVRDATLLSINHWFERNAAARIRLT